MGCCIGYRRYIQMNNLIGQMNYVIGQMIQQRQIQCMMIITCNPLCNIMIEANKLIFPSPHYPPQQQTAHLAYANYLIHLPSTSPRPSGCFCSSIIAPKTASTPSLSSARTSQKQTPRPPIKIQSSKIAKPTMIEPTNKRRSIKRINLVATNPNSAREKELPACKTTRQTLNGGFQEQLFTLRVQHYFAKKKNKFLSDDLYDDENDVGVEEQINRVVLPLRKIALGISQQHSLGSKLWQFKEKSSESSIPCIFIENHRHSEQIIVYFHGNGEDVFGCSVFLEGIASHLGISILAVEYPGYSVYEGSPTCQQIEKNAFEIIECLVDIGYNLKNIIVMGRSIGSGPAIHISSVFTVGALILLSPFLSLCQVVDDLYGKVASTLLKQRFDNKEKAKKVSSPTMIVHGTRDRIISQRHTIELSRHFRSYVKVQLVENMSHSVFNHQEFYRLLGGFCRSLELV